LWGARPHASEEEREIDAIHILEEPLVEKRLEPQSELGGKTANIMLISGDA